MGKDEDRLDSDYSGRPHTGRPTTKEIAAAHAAAPRRARFGNDEALIFKDGTAAVEGSDGKWYVEGSDGQPDLSQPVELVNDRMERLRKGNDGRWYIVGDDGKLDLGRPVELAEGLWVEVTPGQERSSEAV